MDNDVQHDTFLLGQRQFDFEDVGMDEVIWNEEVDFTIPNNFYTENEFSKIHIDEKWFELQSTTALQNATLLPAQRNQVQLTDLNEQQREAAIVWRQICSNDLDAPIQHSNLLSNAMIINGVGGTGKSYLIDAMITQTLALPENRNKWVLVMAPTGKAALNASGFTLHSANGLLIPIHNNGSDLKGETLLRIQERYKNICAVIIDEYSMISLHNFNWIERRLRQAKTRDMPFGGIPIAFVGDPGQLPPVGGLSVWETKTPNNLNLSGAQLNAAIMYSKIQNVMKLSVVRRQADISTIDFLNRLRDGKSTTEDWSWLQIQCTAESIKRRHGEEYFKNKFETSDTIHIYFTNAESNSHNIKALRNLNTPIVQIKAEHDPHSGSRNRSSDTTNHLPALLYLARGAKVMLLQNVSVLNGLVNGSSGIVKDFLYHSNSKAPNRPYAIIIEFEDYKGPAFFSSMGQEKWVPLRSDRYAWGEKSEHYRISFPITLRYAITAWKSQGSTIQQPIVANLGDKEPDHGCTYVVLSRCTNFDNICIGNGITENRLTNLISKGKKLQTRLKEDNRLQTLYTATRDRYMQYFN